jgi:hypothetical protein
MDAFNIAAIPIAVITTAAEEAAPRWLGSMLTLQETLPTTIRYTIIVGFLISSNHRYVCLPNK